MKRIFLLAVLFGGVVWAACLAADRPQPVVLDGKDVIVRVYQDCQREPAAFELMPVKVGGRKVRFDFDEVDESAFVAILAEDQPDETMKQLIGDRVYGWAYRKGLEFSLPTRARASTKDYCWSFVDALGNPIPQATVEIFSADYGNPTKVRIRKVLLDEKGRVKMPALTGQLNRLSLIVSHPDYGIAFVEEVYPWHRETHFLPLSKMGTEADERSIWGVVVDPEGNPVEGAVVTGGMAYTRGRGKIHSRSFSNTVLTDPTGRFAMHLPVKKTQGGPTTIPPVCDYEVSVKAPQELGLMRYSGRVPNGQETTIVLQKRPEKFFRTFAFEDENGLITDPNRLKDIIIIKGRTLSGRSYGYDSRKQSLMLPLGTYRAVIRTTGPERHELDRIEVTADSPQELIFKIGNKVTYAGKVVDGLTGQPVPGAFIIATGWFRRDFSAVTAEQWALLHELPAYLSGDEPALEPVRKICDFEKISRSESDGKFYLSFGPSDKFYQLIVFEQDCLHVAHRRDRFKPDEYNYVQLPGSRLYPAAKIIIEPYVETVERNSRLIGWWYIDEDNNPAWIKDFQAYRSTRKASFTQLLKRDLGFNKPQTIQVLAGVDMQIRLVYIGSGKGKKWWCPVLTEMFNAGQGETVDLGRYSPFEQEMPIYVEVVDSAGNPLEGIGVKHLDMSGSYFGQTHITDSNGIAEFAVPLYYQASFAVGYRDENQQYIRESITYQTNGPQDANNVYTLQVSDEILCHLFK